MACDRTLAASDQLIVALTVGTTGRVRSVAEKRDFIPNGYFFSGAYKYNPNRPNEGVELRKYIKGVDTPF